MKITKASLENLFVWLTVIGPFVAFFAFLFFQCFLMKGQMAEAKIAFIVSLVSMIPIGIMELMQLLPERKESIDLDQALMGMPSSNKEKVIYWN